MTTVQDMGLCRDDVEQELQDVIDRLTDEFGWAIAEAEARNELLDSMAHIVIEMEEDRTKAPAEMESLLVEEGFIHILPSVEDGRLTLRLTPERFFEKMAEGYRDSE